jgi:O-methyltransferase
MNTDTLINDVSRLSLVTKERFDNIVSFKEKISNLDGDIVECGVWKGGMSIFLSKLFNDKRIWVCDSFKGCQDPSNGMFPYARESHKLGQYSGGSLEAVKNNFKQHKALDKNRVFFLDGWVKDTLSIDTCPIKNISLLRIDVDSYSATLEVLTLLYDKVVPAGMIIFDDSCLLESSQAIKDFFKQRNLQYVFSPINNLKIDIFVDTTIGKRSGMPCGCYFFKPEEDKF